MLTPLAEDLGGRLEGLGEHHPLALVHERLARLVYELQQEPPLVDKMRTLQELGFLKEHSLNEEMADFHNSVQRAVDEVMTARWR